MKWGSKYPAAYVNILYASVARNITGPFRFICMADDATGLRPEVVVHPIPDLGCEIPPDVPGMWRKTVLWSANLCGEMGPALFIDLDVVITGNLDSFFEFGEPNDVILARNPVRPFERLGQSSVFRFAIGGHTYMLDDLRADPVGVSRRYRFEQRYTTKCIRPAIRFWPRGWVAHFRFHCLGGLVNRYLRPAKLPSAAKIVIFPGGPKPEGAIVGRWYPELPRVDALTHLTDPSSRKPGQAWRAHARRYLLPVRWVAEHWRE
jgi:hypothetical protein